MSDLLEEQAEQLFRDNEDVCFSWLHFQQWNMNSQSFNMENLQDKFSWADHL